MKTRMFRSFAAGLILLLAGGAASGPAQANQDKPKPATINLPAVLEKSGYSYTKVGDGVYEIPATGKNLKEFPMRVVQAEDLLLVIAKIADRKSLTLKDALMLKLLELNDNYDIVKFALSADMLYARIDIRARLVDNAVLKDLVEVMAQVVDEAYPHIKQFIAGAK